MGNHKVFIELSTIGCVNISILKQQIQKDRKENHILHIGWTQ
jgi:hypothetical protein